MPVSARSWGAGLKHRFPRVPFNFGQRVEKNLLKHVLPSARTKDEKGYKVPPKMSTRQKYSRRSWALGEFPTTVTRPGRGAVSGGAAFPRTFTPTFKEYKEELDGEHHKQYIENEKLPTKPWDLGVIHAEYYDDGETNWHKTLLPKKNPFSGSIQAGKFYKEPVQKVIHTYHPSELEKTRYLDRLLASTYGSSQSEADVYRQGVYKDEWDSVVDAPVDPDAVCTINKFKRIDRRMDYWEESLMGRRKKQKRRNRDLENENDPFTSGNFDLSKNGANLANLSQKDMDADETLGCYNVVLPEIIAPLDFQDMIRMKRVLNVNTRMDAKIRPWHGAISLNYNPQHVASHVGWSLFANSRFQLESDPLYSFFKPGLTGIPDPDEDPIPVKPSDGGFKPLNSILDDTVNPQLDFFNVLHIKSNSSTKIVAAGRVESYSELIVAGNGRGCGAFGYGRGRSFEEATENAYKDVYKNLLYVPLTSDRNLWSGKVQGKDHCAHVEIKSTIGARSNKGNVLLVIMLELIGIQGATAKRWGSRNIFSQIRAFFKALAITGDGTAWASLSRQPIFPNRLFSNAAYVEPRNLKKVYDDFELVEGGFGYHQEARLVMNNIERLSMMKKERKEYLANLKRQKSGQKQLELA